MTAVNPTRLRFQIEGVLAFFDSPEECHRRLRDLFLAYGNRALKFGESAAPVPLIPMYHLPRPVMRQLELELYRHVQLDPQSALLLADELWRDDYYEIRQTAILIIGSVPIDEPDLIVRRLKEWLTPDLDASLSKVVLSIGTKSLQTDFPDAWESLIRSFLQHESSKIINFGLIGLIEGLESPSFTNLPAIFRLVSPFIRDPNSETMRSLGTLIEALVKHSPIETAFFLKQALSISDSSETVRLVKNAVEYFPESLQQDLKTTLKR